MKLSIYLGLLFAVFVVMSAPVRGAETAPHDPEQGAQAALEAMVETDGGSGAMAAVMREGELIWHGEAGHADLEAQIPMREDHRLRIGSVSKLLTAALVLRMEEQGVANTSIPTMNFVPDVPAPLGLATLEQLSRHLGGVRQYDFANFAEANNQVYYTDLWSPLTMILDEPPFAEPGQQFEYSSLGFNLVGAALEHRTGKTFPALFFENLAEPLGLEDSLANDSMAIIPRRARFYTVTVANPMFEWMQDGGLINTIFRDDSDLYPSGGLLSSAIDLARFGDSLFSGAYISDAQVARLVEETMDGDGRAARLGGDGYGMGTVLYREGEEVIAYGHGGLTNGAQAELMYFPATRTTIALITNYNMMSESAFHQLARETLPRLFDARGESDQ